MSECERHGLSAQTIQAIHSVFEKHSGIDSVVLYGSRAMGNFRPGSDIDLVIYSSQLSLTELLKIENEIDDLMLPQKVDLSLFSKINNQNLVEHIERAGKVFYKNTNQNRP